MAKGALIQIGEVAILKTSILLQEYKYCCMATRNDHTWVYFQEWLQETCNLKDETATTAASLGFEANLQANDDAIYDAYV